MPALWWGGWLARGCGELEMKEANVDLWEARADCRVITTNGFVKTNGKAVMGRGCAREASDKFPGLARDIGMTLEHCGVVPTLFILQQPHVSKTRRTHLITLPVKYHWQDKADIELIVRSTKLLVELVDRHSYESVVLPRPGCGNGWLNWSFVKPWIEPLLDNRFTAVHLEGK